MTNTSALGRLWRPLMMYLFMALVVYNYVLAPAFGLRTSEIPDLVWQVMFVAVGLYTAGRTLEKKFDSR